MARACVKVLNDQADSADMLPEVWLSRKGHKPTKKQVSFHTF